MKKVILVLIFTLCFPLICFGIEYEVSGSDKNGNHVYGEVDVDQWDGEGYVQSENELNEKCIASPAVSQKQIFIRSEKYIYCIGRSR